MTLVRVLCGAIVAAWLVLMISQTRDKSLWLDENFTILEAIGQVPFVHSGNLDDPIDSQRIWTNANLVDVIRATVTGDNGNMSLFILLEHLTVRLAGTERPGDFAILPILCYGVSIVWTYRLARYLFDERVGLLAGFLCACNSWMLLFAMEIRAYAPGVALALISTECFARIAGIGVDDQSEQSQNRPSLTLTFVYASVSLAALFTHYLTAIILISHVIFAILTIRDRARWVQLICAGAFVAVAFLLIRWSVLRSEGYSVVDRYITYLQDSGRYKRTPASIKGLADRIAASIFVMSGLTSLPSIGPIPAKLYALAIPVTLLGIAVAVAMISRADSRTRTLQPFLLICILAWSFVAVVLIALMRGHAQIPNNLRYLVFPVPYFSILIALAMVRVLSFGWARSYRLAAYTLIGIYIVLALYAPLKLPLHTWRPENWLGNGHALAAERIAASLEAGDSVKVVVPSVLDMQLIAFYLGPNRNVEIEVADRARAGELLDRTRKQGFEHPLAYYIETRDAYADEGFDISRIVLVREGDSEMRFVYEPKEKSSAPTSP